MAPSQATSLLPRIEQRYLIVLCCFLATFTAYVERVGFSIAFTAMAQAAELDESIKGTVLSAFYWGYGLSQVPGGWAAQQYGGRRTLIMSFALWSTVSLLTPGDGKNYISIIVARVCIGVAQGFLIPAVHTVLSQWIPPHEKARAVSFSTSGMYLGSACSMWFLPSIATVYGPQSLLRVVGGLGLAWLSLWLFLGRDIPHRESVTPLSAAEQGDKSLATAHAKGRPAPTPWGGMMRSTAVWAIVSSNFSFHYAFYVVLNWLPTYFASLLRTDLASLGFVKTLPYLVMFATSNLGGWMGDWLIVRQKYPIAAARKTVNTLGFFSAATALMLMPMADSVSGGLLFTTLSLGALGFSRGGFSVNHMDIAPKYAGVLMGISNTAGFSAPFLRASYFAGTISGVIGVEVTGVILDWCGGSKYVSGWFWAHTVSSTILAIAAVNFSIAAKGDRIFD